MDTAPANPAPFVTTGPRRIRFRTAGHTHGPITRLMSPGDLGRIVKPFVFLDLAELGGEQPFPELPMHPHSGIATHTTMLAGSLSFADSTGKSGALRAGSVEYMQAGGGVWHTGKPLEGGPLRAFQLWMALPAELELSPAESHYVDVNDVPGDGRLRVLLGSYGGMSSVIPSPWSATYLHVTLRDGEAWRYEPAAGHDVAWLAVSLGGARVDGAVLRREMAVFEEGGGAIDVVAVGETELVIASAVKHPHELVTGMYSVHTSADALQRGEAGYRRVAAELRRSRGAGAG